MLLLGDKTPKLLTSGPTGANNQHIIFVNGVWNIKESAQRHGDMMGDTLQSRVKVVWNPTQGTIRDLLQTLMNKLNVRDATTDLVIRTVRDEIHLLAPGETVKLFGHSQGAAIIASATRYLTAEERGRIDLTTYGGAAYTYPAGFHSRRNVVNIADFFVGDIWGNGALPFTGEVGLIALLFNQHLDYTVFFADLLHGFEGYWQDDHEPSNRVSVTDAEERRHELAIKNWNKR